MTNVVVSDAVYTHVFSYYLYVNGKEVKIKLNKNDILNVLSDKKNEIKDFVLSNKLTYSKEEDVYKILEYYDSI